MLSVAGDPPQNPPCGDWADRDIGEPGGTIAPDTDVHILRNKPRTIGIATRLSIAGKAQAARRFSLRAPPLAPLAERLDHAAQGPDLLVGQVGALEHVADVAHHGRDHLRRVEEAGCVQLPLQMLE